MKKRARGFTLIEILVALMILAIIGVLMVTGLRSAIRSQGTINKRSAQLADLQSAMMIMEREVAQIINRPIYDVDGSMLPAVFVRYEGGKLHLEFTRAGYVNPFGAENRTTMLRVRYSWNGTSLIRTTWSVLDRVQNSPSTSATMLTGINTFNVRFLDSNGQFSVPGDTPAIEQILQQYTTQTSPLPLAIEINIDVDGFGLITRLVPLPS